jgi:hypothetical protein
VNKVTNKNWKNFNFYLSFNFYLVIIKHDDWEDDEQGDKQEVDEQGVEQKIK